MQVHIALMSLINRVRMLDIGYDISVRQHHSLGLPDRAGGVEETHEIVFAPGNRSESCRGAAQEILIEDIARAQLLAQRDKVIDGGQFRSYWIDEAAERGIEHHRARA